MSGRQRRNGLSLPTARKLSLGDNETKRFHSGDVPSQWNKDGTNAESKTKPQINMEKKGEMNNNCVLRCSAPLQGQQQQQTDVKLKRKCSLQFTSPASCRTRGMVQHTGSHLMTVLGYPGVGKTALIVRYVTGRFVHEYDPTLEMTYEKLQELGNVKGILRIMDTAGSIENCMCYIKQAEGIIVVYSITDRYSFQTAKHYLKLVKDYSARGTPFDYELPTILVGNKRELRRAREVSRDEGREMAKDYGCLFVESSAAYDRNVQNIFTNLFVEMHRIKEERQRTITSNSRGFVNSVRSFFQTKRK